ncbi:MAG: tetraacyldisaccharide 4'-kinase [bacterium]|nr:tetraacyldisaccharide 4'-kinase [bacterium]
MHSRHPQGNSPLHRLKLLFLNAVSIVFKTISFFNLKRKARHAQTYPRAFIISIDNLSFGGTGKTTLVTAIGEFLETRNIPFAIVTRGYKSTLEHKKESTKVRAGHSASDVGDEACMFRKNFPRHDIYVGKNRRDSIQKAGADKNKIILLDDGFQSSHVRKNLSIMLINPGHPYYYLRNFKRLMKREDIVLCYRENIEPCPVPVCGSYHFEHQGFYDALGQPVDIARAPIAGFSALGDNHRFQQDLESFQITGFRGFSDHYAFSLKDLEELDRWRIGHNAKYLVCTEKDFIKIMHYNLPQIPFIYSKNSIKFNIDLTDCIVNHAKEENYI